MIDGCSTAAVVLRRIEHGDFDMILRLFTRERGKVSAIAKNAKKSKKRFAGALELFTRINVVLSPSRGGMPVLAEARVDEPFAGIREQVERTAWAGYFCELIDLWMEEQTPDERIFALVNHALSALASGEGRQEETAILFQMRFMALAGMGPVMNRCVNCGAGLSQMTEPIRFDLEKGGLMCKGCETNAGRALPLAKGTIKQLLWVEEKDIGRAGRIRFTTDAITEGLRLLEAFVPYHLGRVPKSLRFIQTIRM